MAGYVQCLTEPESDMRALTVDMLRLKELEA